MTKNPYRRPDARTRAAKAKGFPARSVFKLEEIDRRLKLLRPGQHVLDLGAAPGSWSMYAGTRVGASGRVLAVDRSEIAGTLGPNVDIVQGDALELSNDDLARHAPYDVVLSDMAPSTTGDRSTDQARSEALFERALDVARALLRPGGSFVGKIFMGPGLSAAQSAVRRQFEELRVLRPEATRASSFEVFLAGLKKRPTQDAASPPGA